MCFHSGACVQSLVWDLRSHIKLLHAMAKKKNKQKTLINRLNPVDQLCCERVYLKHQDQQSLMGEFLRNLLLLR